MAASQGIIAGAGGVAATIVVAWAMSYIFQNIQLQSGAVNTKANAIMASAGVDLAEVKQYEEAMKPKLEKLENNALMMEAYAAKKIKEETNGELVLQTEVQRPN